jgi:hypothetical protein
MFLLGRHIALAPISTGDKIHIQSIEGAVMKIFIWSTIVAVGVIVGVNIFSSTNRVVENPTGSTQVDKKNSLQNTVAENDNHQKSGYSNNEPMTENVVFESVEMSEEMIQHEQQKASQAADQAIEQGLIDPSDKEDYKEQFISHTRSVAEYEYEAMTE